jgi:hypothetical protein
MGELLQIRQRIKRAFLPPSYPGEYQAESSGERHEFAVWHDAFPVDLHQPLIDLSDSLKRDHNERKHVYEFNLDNLDQTNLPPAIFETINSFQQQFPYWPINTAVLKRYAPNEPSDAYVMHRDPKKFWDFPIALISLDGEAMLTIKDSQGVTTETPCTAGTFVMASSVINHGISPPLNPDGIRHFLFLGYNNELDQPKSRIRKLVSRRKQALAA